MQGPARRIQFYNYTAPKSLAKTNPKETMGAMAVPRTAVVLHSFLKWLSPDSAYVKSLPNKLHSEAL